MHAVKASSSAVHLPLRRGVRAAFGKAKEEDEVDKDEGRDGDDEVEGREHEMDTEVGGVEEERGGGVELDAGGGAAVTCCEVGSLLPAASTQSVVRGEAGWKEGAIAGGKGKTPVAWEMLVGLTSSAEETFIGRAPPPAGAQVEAAATTAEAVPGAVVVGSGS